MKIYVESHVVSMKLLRDLKKKFNVVYEYGPDVKLRLNNNSLFINENEIDCTHWIEKIEEGDIDLSFADLIDRILIEFSDVMDIII